MNLISRSSLCHEILCQLGLTKNSDHFMKSFSLLHSQKKTVPRHFHGFSACHFCATSLLFLYLPLTVVPCAVSLNRDISSDVLVATI